MDAWVQRELGDSNFPDQRLKTRLGKLLGDLGQRIGGTVPAACQDWAATKAAYRQRDFIDRGVENSGANSVHAKILLQHPQIIGNGLHAGDTCASKKAAEEHRGQSNVGAQIQYRRRR